MSVTSASKSLAPTSAEIIDFNAYKLAKRQAEQEFMNYLVWTMKHEFDPHELYDDPIEVFRKEYRA